MGIISEIANDLAPTTQEDHEEAYAQGVEDSKDPSISDDINHELDVIPNPIESETNPDYEAGYHSGESSDKED